MVSVSCCGRNQIDAYNMFAICIYDNLLAMLKSCEVDKEALSNWMCEILNKLDAWICPHFQCRLTIQKWVVWTSNLWGGILGLAVCLPKHSLTKWLVDISNFNGLGHLITWDWEVGKLGVRTPTRAFVFCEIRWKMMCWMPINLSLYELSRSSMGSVNFSLAQSLYSAEPSLHWEGNPLLMHPIACTCCAPLLGS